MNNIKNKHNLCFLVLVVSFVIGWKVLADTPWPGVNLTFGLCLGIIVYLAALTYVDGPLGPLVVRGNLERIGLVNRKGEAPFLLRKSNDPNTPNGMILLFEDRGIPFETWEEKRAEIEAAFNIFVVKIIPGKNRRLVEVYAVPAVNGLPDKVTWTDNLLSVEEFVLVLGQGLAGLVTVNLAIIPHILIGGATGSGKSILLKLLLMQCLKKDASLYLCDFKDGLDYPGWRHICHMVCSERKLLDTLKELTGELETRKNVLRKAGYPNLETYNKKVRHIYKRIIIAIDEVAEVLDKTGRTKEDKERIDTIIGHLSTIARQGRAVGIHLILSTQRPDASILVGQIKNNIDCRICGRSDNVLSQIVIDSTDAADAIPKDAQGRFIMGDGTVFQAFWDDNIDDWFTW